MKIEVAVLGFLSLTVLTVFVDVKQHLKKKNEDQGRRLIRAGAYV